MGKSKPARFYIPKLPLSGRSSKIRQAFIKFSVDYLPNLLDGDRIDDGKRYRVVVTFRVVKSFSTDIDNLIKAVLDSLKGRVIPDDSQVHTVEIRRRMYTKDKPIGTYIELYEEHEPA